MACYHPMRAIVKGVDDKGKKILRILPYEVVSREAFDPYCEWFEIPCGKCLGCRQANSIEWSNRLILESLYHDSAYFITLTYNDDNVPKCYGVESKTGEIGVFNTLKKDDVQRFIKRIRFNSGSKDMRYYLAGEYGDKTCRPHYHAIIFGLELADEDLIPCGFSETGNQYFRSKFLERNWINTDNGESLGFVSCEPANYYTMKYVSAYVTKKLGNKPNEVYLSRGQIPPFSISSKNPAIGLRYLHDHPECIESGSISLGLPDQGLKIPTPGYFYRKYYEECPGDAERIKKKRQKICEDRREAEFRKQDKPYLEYLQVKENKHVKRLRSRKKI